jgi:hypothetical protein
LAGCAAGCDELEQGFLSVGTVRRVVSRRHQRGDFLRCDSLREPLEQRQRTVGHRHALEVRVKVRHQDVVSLDRLEASCDES